MELLKRFGNGSTFQVFKWIGIFLTCFPVYQEEAVFDSSDGGGGAITYVHIYCMAKVCWMGNGCLLEGRLCIVAYCPVFSRVSLVERRSLMLLLLMVGRCLSNVSMERYPKY